MRLLRLEFNAFGSYPGHEVVDFTVLAEKGLFVVTGPTGAGKTTIFDAMVYALFDDLPGERSGRTGEVRSQHASPNDLTWVTLDFEVHGVQYRVHREPTQERPKQKGTGTTKHNAQASLVEVVGDEGRPLTEGAKDVTAQCQELVGLTANQFQRVVLLPQGKFTQFLIATDKDREELLGQLFDGQVYDRVLAHLKATAADLGSKVADIDTQIHHHRANALDAINAVREAWVDQLGLEPHTVSLSIDLDDPLFEHTLRESLEQATPALGAAQERHAAARQARDDAKELLNTVQLAQERHDKKRDALAQRQSLDLERDSVHLHASAAERSRSARPATEAAAAHDHAQQARALAQTQFDALLDELVEMLGLLSISVDSHEPAVISKAIADQQALLASQQQQLRATQAAALQVDTDRDALHRAVSRVTQIAASRTELAAAATALDAERALVAPAAADVERYEREVGAAESLVATRRTADDATAAVTTAEALHTHRNAEYHSLLQRFIAGAAPRLAATLRPHEACPVCGSHEHPAPAEAHDGAIVDQVEVDEARLALQQASEQLDAATKVFTAATALLGDAADATLEQLAERANEARSRRAAANEAATRLLEITEQQAALAVQQGSLGDEFSAATGAQVEAQTRLDLSTSELQRLSELTASIDPDQLANAVGLADTASRGVAAFSHAHAATVSTTAAAATAAEHAEQALAQSGFVDIAEAQAAVLPLDEEAAALAARDTWRTESTAVDTLLSTLTDAPEVRPDTEAAQAAFDAANTAASEAERRYLPVKVEFERVGTSLDAAATTLGDAAGLYERHQTAQVVFRTCNGDAGLGVKLQRWVLGGELDRVAAAANVHLASMTQSRYSLARSLADKKALTLEVFDASTGQARGTGTLSGGEQFQASLALALGLADVISMGGSTSGKHFQSLFIDEGFGSLDAAALDQAIDTLRQLHATGRMVGAITHVEAMKTELPIGIEVTRRPDGKGSTLTVTN
jgi:exonuclease SbcC